MRRPPAFLPATLALLAVMAGGLFLGAGFLARGLSFERPPLAAVLSGRAAAEVEEAFERANPVRAGIAGGVNALAYSLFGEARKGALAGRDGWLFSREEFERGPDAERLEEHALGFVREAAQRLDARGIRLAVLLLPLKADIGGKALLPRRLPPGQAALYGRVQASLGTVTGLILPDLRTPLLALAQGEPAFLRSDTHWTPHGADAAAAATVAALPPDLDLPPAAFAPVARPPVLHRGDLTRFLDFGPFRAPIAAEPVAPFDARPEDAAIADLFGDAPPPAVLLVGTSYSADPLWSFEPALKRRLGADILNLAAPGAGPFQPMAQVLRRLEAGEIATPRLVFWEMPVRYFAMSAAQDTPDF